MLDVDGQDKLRTLVRLSQRAEAMVQALVELSRLGQTELGLAPIELHELIEEVLASLHDRLQEARAEVRIPAALPRVRCDPGLIAIVYRHLIANAIQYSDAARRWVELGCERIERDPSAGHGAGAVLLWVQDNGIGIEPALVGGVFKLFRPSWRRSTAPVRCCS